MWFLTTDTLLPSDDLEDHFQFVQELLYPAPDDGTRIAKLHTILRRGHAHARVTCFWRGDFGETPPEIPPRFKRAMQSLAADIETDFLTE